MNHASPKSRRSFVKDSLIAGITLSGMAPLSLFANKDRSFPGQEALNYSLDLQVPTRLFDGEKCWVHPRAGVVPEAVKEGMPRMVMTMNTLDLSGSDVFKGMFGMHSDDGGANWTAPEALPSLAPRFEQVEGEDRPVAASDFWPTWHKDSKTLLGTGHTIVYTKDWKVAHPRPRHTAFAVYEPDRNLWSDWEKLDMGDNEKFQNAGAGCVQRWDEPDGNILLPIYFTPPGSNSQVTVTRCAFDGKALRFLEQGNDLSIDDDSRGLHEPSLTHFQGKYFLTIRNDNQGFVTHSDDGLHYAPIQPWKFDDGTDLGNYNTQQHWVMHSEALYLVYTRRGAGNDHVFRHRAPLFMARVDPEKLEVIRHTERILVPERGARLGNFGVTAVSPDETWVTVSEWMQPEGVEKQGSDGSVYVAKIRWTRPNASFSR
ncbi:exo-alpha-sialidase [Cyclobacterium plantarum]|uniref:exo-alpha-sialidase n=1 Tax=Cyclobacterium plantarum TaxID=2716263 RepID=UPI003F6F3CC0